MPCKLLWINISAKPPPHPNPPLCYRCFQCGVQVCNYLTLHYVYITVDIYCQEKSSIWNVLKKQKIAKIKFYFLKLFVGILFFKQWISNRSTNPGKQGVIHQTLKQMWLDGHQLIVYINIYQLKNINISYKQIFSPNDFHNEKKIEPIK